MGIELKPKKKEAANEELLKSDALKIQRYVNLHGMFEMYKDKHYQPLNTSVNKDQQTWKTYQNTMKENEHGLMELGIDMSDAAV